MVTERTAGRVRSGPDGSGRVVKVTACEECGALTASAASWKRQHKLSEPVCWRFRTLEVTLMEANRRTEAEKTPGPKPPALGSSSRVGARTRQGAAITLGPLRQPDPSRSETSQHALPRRDQRLQGHHGPCWLFGSGSGSGSGGPAHVQTGPSRTRVPEADITVRRQHFLNL